MRKAVLLTLGLVLFIVLGSSGAVIFLRNEVHGFSARSDPTSLEIAAARTARSLALPSEARDRPNPLARTPEALDEAIAHWADHCAVCHGNDGAGDVEMGKQMYPHAPDMRKQGTQKLTDGELFYIIENGIRLSGMPAWGGSKAAEQSSWKLVHFIRHLPELSDEEMKQMEKLNPKSPGGLQREQAEHDFLNGKEPTEAPKRHQHPNR
jgi:mono/diheme cytochrome c family protein